MLALSHSWLASTTGKSRHDHETASDYGLGVRDMKRPLFAQSLSRLAGENAFDVLAKAKALEAQGRNVIHLEIGEPDFDTPPHIKEAAVKALWDGYTHYTPSQGMPVLREAAAEHLTSSRKVQFNPDDIIVTPGAKPILFFTILALVDPGDEVIYPNPGFPTYESVVNYVGGVPVPIALREENQFRMDVAEIRSKVTERTKLIILNSPQNPTGSVLTIQDMEGIAEIAESHDLMVLCDEIYSRTPASRRSATTDATTGMPAARNTSLARCLCMASADASTPEWV